MYKILEKLGNNWTTPAYVFLKYSTKETAELDAKELTQRTGNETIVKFSPADY